MKKIFLVLSISIFVLSSCKKDTNSGNTPPATAVKYTPNLITPPYQPGVSFDLNTFHIYDLNHDDNKEKKYFRIKFITGDSAAIIKEPNPIDSFAVNWPADVKKVLFGSGQVFIVNDQFYLSYSSGAFARSNYNQVSPQHSWLIQHRSTVGAGAGLPNAEVSFSSSNYRLFYFSTRNMSYYTGASPYPYSLADIGSAAGMGAPFNIYDYTDVTNLIYIKSPSNPSFYFFDYKNWKYWRVSWEYIAQFQEFRWYGWPVKSLDSFVKWPEGWGKK
jgi:hypothetical protein